MNEGQEVDTRKEASDKFKVSEMRVGPKKPNQEPNRT